MKKLFTISLIVLNFVLVFAQSGSGIGAKVVDSKTGVAMQNVIASIQNLNLTEITDSKGKFVFKNVPIGKQLLLIRNQGYKDQLLQIEIQKGKILEIGTIQLEEDVADDARVSTINISDAQLSDDNSGSENTNSLLQSARDAFLQTAAFNWGQARFSVRGIDNEYSNVMINGVSMNKTADGRPQYGDWGGLNDATRNQEFSNGSAPSDYVFGGIAGTQEINTRASIYRKGTRLSFLNTNTNYSFRTMGTHVSGMNTDGWAYVISAGRRWSQEGYFEGTNYSANSLFASVEKRINDHHSLNFTSIYAQNRRGKNSPNSTEVQDLVGEKYNSYWGYQDGRKRNSRVKKSEEPMFMLTDYWKINSNTTLNTTLSFQTGQIGNSRLDFFLANNPDPVYYQNLPSYNETFHTSAGVFIPNLVEAQKDRLKFIADPQVNWNKIYDANRQTLANGSRYVLYEDRNDENIAALTMNLSSKLSDNIFLNAGGNYLDSRTKNFKNLIDLLGGAYYNDINTFGFGSQQQNDLNNPDRKVIVGDKYGYNYNINTSKLDAFTQFKFVYKKIDFYLAQTFSKSTYQREGLYKNGFFPEDTFGESEKLTFDNFGFKGGITLKINGRNYIDFNSIYMSKAPNSKDVFPNARVNNFSTVGITNETIRGLDLSYIVRMPSFKARFTGYFNEVLNSTDINFYYSDATTAFVSETVTGINKRNRGVEVGLEYQLTSTLKFTGAAAWGEFIFTNNPLVALNSDNGVAAGAFIPQKANLEGYKQAGSPQQAYSIGAEYRDPKFWWIGINANYLGDNYIDVSTLTRTNYFYSSDRNDAVIIDQAKADEYLKQEKFDPIRLLNLVGGKSWRIAKKYNVGLFANVNNVLDYKYKTGGFEQARSSTYRDINEDRVAGTAGSFGPRYFNGYGRTYSVSLSLTF
jgi:hypothetical protein